MVTFAAEPSTVLSAWLAAPLPEKELGTTMHAGWTQLRFRPQGMDTWQGPSILGYAVTSLRNKDQNGNYGSVVPHVRLRGWVDTGSN